MEAFHVAVVGISIIGTMLWMHIDNRHMHNKRLQELEDLKKQLGAFEQRLIQIMEKISHKMGK